jgi:hypothetical protein
MPVWGRSSNSVAVDVGILQATSLPLEMLPDAVDWDPAHGARRQEVKL